MRWATKASRDDLFLEIIRIRNQAIRLLMVQHDLDMGRHTFNDIIAATAYALPSIEIVDSRIADWDITIVDQSPTHYYQPGFLFVPFGFGVGCVFHSRRLRPVGMGLATLGLEKSITTLRPWCSRAATRSGASGGKKKKDKKPEPAAQETNPAAASVTLFMISTELTAVNEDDVSGELFVAPAGWEKVSKPAW